MIIKKRNFSKEVMNKPVSDTYVYYTKADKKIRKITLKTLLRKLNRVLEDQDHRIQNEIKIDMTLVGAARNPLDRMLSFSI